MATNSLGRIWRDISQIPFEILDVEKLQRKIEKLGYDHFIDPSFPPADSSIYDNTSESESPFEDKIVWKRPIDFMEETPEVFSGDIDPNDIVQGGLGDCWFLASIASLAEFPVFIKKLFITQSYNEFGIYRLRICKNGEWIEVTIDDYIPCSEDSGPIFTSSKANELWVLLLEKAYAKLHGNYAQLRAGFVTHGLMDLSGCPTSKYNFPMDRSDFSAIKEYSENLWHVVVDADSKGYIMCAGTPGVDIFTEGEGPQEDHGIVPGHAYSVIQAKQYKNIRLLNIRNPWGEFEWGGAWSDNDSHWDDETIRFFNPTFDENDGAFWMSYEDFFLNFDSLSICKTQNWNELRLKGKFIRVLEDNNSSNDWVISQFCYSFEAKSHVEIGIHQEDERIQGAEKRPYLDMGLVILKRSDDGTLSVAAVAENETVRDLEGDFTLEPGNYIAVPVTTGGFLKAPNISSEPVKLKVNVDGTQLINSKAYSAILDLFRKVDMQMDGILTSKELNQFGKIANEPFFSSITDDSFSSKEFENISCNKHGVTCFGFFQLLNRLPEERLQSILTNMGYDEHLFSFKSRVFVISFHSTEDLKVRILDGVKSKMTKKAMSLMMDYFWKKDDSKIGRQDENVIVIKRDHDAAYANSYAAINKTDSPVEITLDLTSSVGCSFTPSRGVSTLTLKPKSMMYLGSSIAEPTATSYMIDYSFTSQIAT